MSSRKRKLDAEYAVSPNDIPSSPATRRSAETSWSAHSSTPTSTKPRTGGRISEKASITQKTLLEYGLYTPPKHPHPRRSTVRTSMTPTKLQKQFKDRLFRARTERMVIIDHSIGYVTRSPVIMFDIVGSVGNIYRVMVKEFPTCDCPDFRYRPGKCKHIFYAMLNALSATEDQIAQEALTKEELSQMVDSSALERIKVEAAAQNTPGTRKPIDGECAICFMDMKEEEKIVWCQYGCGNNLHSSCFKKWSATCRQAVSCVYCRAVWSPAESNPKAQAIREAGVRRGRYINVADQFGMTGSARVKHDAEPSANCP